MPKRLAIALPVVVAVISTSQAEPTLKKEPPMGALKEGEVVLVDDGSCPKGQIKQVVGGNHIKAGGYKNIVRTRSCIPR